MKPTLQPDIIFEPTKEIRNLKDINAIDPSYDFDDSITDVRFVLDEIFIKRRMDPVGKNEIYFSTIITDDISEEPSTFKSEIFEKIKKNSGLPIANKEVYRTKFGGHSQRRSPGLISFSIVVMESDQRSREFGKVVDDIRQTDEFKKIRKSIIGAAAVTVPATVLITAATDFGMLMLGKALSMNKDDQVIYITGSFDAFNDDLGVIYRDIVLENDNARVTFRIEKV